MIEWWISNACYSKEASGVLNIWSRVMQCSSRGEEGASKVLEIVSEVGRQGEYIHRLGGYSWSGDIILDAIQLEGNLLSIIYGPWFVDWTLKFISKTTNSLLCSHISLVGPCSSSCPPRWRRWVGHEGECTVHVRYKLNIQWQPYIRQWA